MLDALILSIPLPIVVLDPEYRVRIWNPAAHATFGWTADEVVGKPYPLVPESRRAEAEQIHEVTRGGRSIKEFETQRQCRDGSLLDVTLWFSPLFDADGNDRGSLSIVHDITERKQSDEERARLEEQLKVAQRMESIGRLSGGVAHDFNNILTTIKGNVELALAELPEDGPREDLEEIRKAADRAATLIRQLLAFSRRQVLSPAPLDLNRIVSDAASLLRRVLGEHIDLRTHLQSDLSPILADPSQMEQVLLNLVVNARDAMPDGGELHITTQDVELDSAFARDRVYELAPGPYVLLSVRDTGMGMEPETLSHAFEPFYTTKRPGEGTGLGLAMVFGIVKQSGGHVEVESSPGEGAEFRIFLPRHDEAAAESAPGPWSTSLAGARTILLAEDDATVLALAERILGRAGYTVLRAGDGEEAIRIAREHTGTIDLVVSDVIMPGMSGRELVDRLEEEGSRARVLFISGYDDERLSGRGVLRAGEVYLPKPFTPAELLQRVRSVLQGAAPDEPPAT